MDPEYRVLYEAIQEIAELCQQRLNKGPDSGDQSTLNICRRALSKVAMVPKPPKPTWTGPQWNGYMVTYPNSWATQAGVEPPPLYAAHNTAPPSISSVETKKPRTRRDAARPYYHLPMRYPPR